jgi:hypothetical protein
MLKEFLLTGIRNFVISAMRWIGEKKKEQL